MKRILIASSWLGMATYCLLSTIAGPSGLIATGRAMESAGLMNSNIAILRTLNETYAGEWEALSSVAETTALEARSLGYLADDEVAIRLSVPRNPPVPASPGERIVYEARSVIDEAAVKEISAIVAFIALAAGMVLRVLRHEPSSRRQREILVQEASRT